MDHIKLLNQVRDEKNIELAFNYALNDRKFSDSYFDHFEIEYVTYFKEKVIEGIRAELQSLSTLHTQAAYAYYMPKTNLCYRRMIYLPFKDLVIRYAFVIILTNHLDITLSPRCFANRKASGKRANSFLLEDYYNVSHPKFRNWQKKCKDKYQVLIRTDISAFYDSISHDYLIQTIAEQLSISVETDFLKLLSKLLCPYVISYSNKTKKLQSPLKIHQGLTIGNNLEGFLANLYLRDVDEAMEDNNIEFGRYNDDMRIFATNREVAHSYLLILQENLLNKGLNLNTAKTLIAENREEIEKLRTKSFYEPSPGLYDASLEIADTKDADLVDQDKANQIEEHIDKDSSLKELLKEFNPEEDIKNDKDAKNFCKYIQNYVELTERIPKHIEKLETVLTRYQGSSKHATWLLVQSTYYNDIPYETQTKAYEVLFNLFKHKNVLSYTKYRLIHHLVNDRQDKDKNQYRLISRLNSQYKEELKVNLKQLLKEPAFELNIVALYALNKLGLKLNELKKNIQKYIPKPVGDPIISAIFYLEEVEKSDNSNKENHKGLPSEEQQQEDMDYHQVEGKEEFY